MPEKKKAANVAKGGYGATGRGHHTDRPRETNAPEPPQAINVPRTGENTPGNTTVDLSQADSGFETSDPQWALSSGIPKSRHTATAGDDGSDGSAQHPPASEPQASKPLVASSFKSSLTGLGVEFAKLGSEHPRSIVSFVTRNPDVQQIPEADFLTESALALSINYESYARNCIHQALILKNFKQYGQRFLQAFLTNEVVRDDFQTEVEKQFEHRKGTVSQSLIKQVGSTSAPGQDDRAYGSPPGRHAAVATPGVQFSQSYKDDRHRAPAPESAAKQRSGNRHSEDSIQRLPFRDGSRGGHSHQGSIARADLKIKEYGVRLSKWFVLGRVFCVIWHEAAASTATQPAYYIHDVDLDTLGTHSIFTRPRRMVVVRQRNGCSWCLPVNTYGGKGLRKKGLEVDAHAIIHMDDQDAVYLEKEPESNKKSIAVVPSDPSQKLDPASRLCFSKVHTIEHNLPVKGVGRVSDKSLPYLLRYFETIAQSNG